MKEKKDREYFVLSIMLFISLMFIVSQGMIGGGQKTWNFKSFFTGTFTDQFGAVGSINSTSTLNTTASSTTSTTTSIKGLPPEAPTNYTDNKNGTITDNYTGLIWKKCTQGMTGNDCKTGSPSLRIWSKARTECDDLVFAGKSDWRMPTLKELQSIVNTKEFDPAINKTFFINTTDNPYWTDTSPAEYQASKFTVLFSDGSVYFRDSNNYAATRCVRVGN